MMLRTSLSLSLCSSLSLLGCAAGEGRGTADPSGLATMIDSTADTVFARVSGAVPEAAIRHLVVEVAIAPDADDTSLFTDVSEFDVDRDGRFWVFDRPSNVLLVFGAEGGLVLRTGRQGAGPGEYNSNNGMVVLGDSGVALWDARNGRLAFLDREGGWLRSWAIPTGFNTSNGLLTDRSGQLFLRRPVTPPREGEILGRMGLVRLLEGGAFGDSLAPPDLPVQREVYVARAEGNTSSTNARHAPNFHWAWHPDGYFVAVHGGQGVVVLERPGAKPLVIVRQAPLVSIEPDERRQEQASITWSMRQTEPGWTWRGPDLPEQKAPIAGVFAARDGRLWVRVAAPSEPIPPAELPIPRDSLQPVVAWRTPVVYEVYAPTGRFLGRVALPPRTTLMEAEGSTVWALARNADDLPAVTRFRIEPALP